MPSRLDASFISFECRLTRRLRTSTPSGLGSRQARTLHPNECLHSSPEELALADPASVVEIASQKATDLVWDSIVVSFFDYHLLFAGF